MKHLLIHTTFWAFALCFSFSSSDAMEADDLSLQRSSVIRAVRLEPFLDKDLSLLLRRQGAFVVAVKEYHRVHQSEALTSRYASSLTRDNYALLYEEMRRRGVQIVPGSVELYLSLPEANFIVLGEEGGQVTLDYPIDRRKEHTNILCSKYVYPSREYCLSLQDNGCVHSVIRAKVQSNNLTFGETEEIFLGGFCGEFPSGDGWTFGNCGYGDIMVLKFRYSDLAYLSDPRGAIIADVRFITDDEKQGQS